MSFCVIELYTEKKEAGLIYAIFGVFNFMQKTRGEKMSARTLFFFWQKIAYHSCAYKSIFLASLINAHFKINKAMKYSIMKEAQESNLYEKKKKVIIIIYI